LISEGEYSFEQSQIVLRANINPMNRELTNAKQRVARAHERLGLQRVRIRTLRTDQRDTNDAEEVFRTMRRTMEAFEEDRLQVEAELLMARASPWFGHSTFDYPT
jgi:hypothetical protein